MPSLKRPMKDPWNPDLYARFQAERSQPFHDLLALVQPRPEPRILDLGCGTGELTRILHERLGARETMGLDRSEAMLAQSVEHGVEGIRFVLGDIETFQPSAPSDLIFSTSALHWVADHPNMLQRLTSLLTGKGQIAFQVPAMAEAATHVIATEIAGEEPFSQVLAGAVKPSPVLEPEAYAILLHRLGYTEQHVRLQVYPHTLESREEVFEWVNGTLLTAYQRHMPDELYDRFFEEYRRRLLPLLDDERPYFFPFRRILAWARR